MLDIRDYDRAMYERIKLFYDNTHFIMRPTIPIKEIRDRKVLQGKDVEFPLVTVRRTQCPIISAEYNSMSRGVTGQAFNTAPLDKPNNSNQANLFNYDKELANKIINDSGHRDGLIMVNSTFNLTYYIDVISFERDNFDTIVVELQENLFRLPFINFDNIKSDGNQDDLIPGQACHVTLEEVEDTSDLENFDTGNGLYRATITVKLNAYIYRKCKAKSIETFNLQYKDELTNKIILDYDI